LKAYELQSPGGVDAMMLVEKPVPAPGPQTIQSSGAALYRQLAEKSENVFGKQELLDLAAVCEEVANSIEDRLTGG
jgi:hypothetical protein